METPTPGPHVAVSATMEPVLIFSGEHRAWWRENRCGYCSDVDHAGRYSLKEAIEATHHCGPEKMISIENDRPRKQTMRLRDFLNAANALNFVDRQEWMSIVQWEQFQRDPIDFLNKADEDVANRIWAFAQPTDPPVRVRKFVPGEPESQKRDVME